MNKLLRNEYFTWLFALTFWLLLVAQPMTSTFFINLNPPDETQLKDVRGEVIDTKNKDPHLTVKLENGEVLKYEFPVFLNSFGSSAFNTQFGKNNEQLMGCKAIMKISNPKFTYYERRRIWEISCENSSSKLSREKIENEYWSDMKFMFFLSFIMGFLVMPAGFYVHFKNSRKLNDR
jgi:hypothetical protein